MGWIVLGIVIVVALTMIAMYNRLVWLRQRVDQTWSDVTVQLKQRHDLVPNLVETVEGYAAQERRTFEAVAQARSAAVTASGPSARAHAEICSPGRCASCSPFPRAIPPLRPTKTLSSCRLTSWTSKP